MIETRREGPAVWLTIARPEASNALSRGVVDGLRAQLKQLASDASVRAVVLTGAGDKVFCGGADLKERRGMTPAETRNFLDDLNALMNELEALPLPTIAAIAGGAFGGGLELALCCDFRLASPGIQLGLTEVRLGIIPGAGGTQRLPRLIGLARAKQVILTGQRFSAERAAALGLCDLCAAPGPAALADAVAALVSELSQAAPISVRQAKEALQGGLSLPLGQGLEHERRCYEVTLLTEDRQEALRAFAEKRPPVFQGR